VLAVRQRAFVRAAPQYSAANNHSPECRGAFSVAASSVGAVSYACAAMQSKILTVLWGGALAALPCVAGRFGQSKTEGGRIIL